MNLTLEAIYLLHVYNNYSDELPFMPLPGDDSSLTYKERLKNTIEKGFQDLLDLGLIIDGELTEEGVKCGYYLKEFHDKTYHYCIDTTYFVAPQVDEYKRMSVVVRLLEDGSYYIDRVTSALLWGYLLEGHKVLHHLEDKMKDYLAYDWNPYSKLRMILQQGDAEGIRISILEQGGLLEDTLYYETNGSIYEYDMIDERQRSIDSEQVMSNLIKKGKVRL